MPWEYFIGLMSGTSMDGIDAAVVAFDDAEIRLVAALNHPWPEDLAARLQALARPGADTVDHLGATDSEAGETFAQAARAVMAEAGLAASRVRAIGSHGQTIRHRPQGPSPFTLQIGDPTRIAEGCGVTTVADFRRRDIAAGGEGAPLVPAFHAAVFRHATEHRVVLNIGGIANITVLPALGRVVGFDTGPGNRLLDDWSQLHTGRPYDEAGTWGATGTPSAALLDALLADPYFDRSPPKSTGTEHFNLEWVRRLAPGLPDLAPADAQASFAELTARTVASAIERHAPATDRLLVCGGGSHNEDLMARIGFRLPSLSVETTTDHGVDADWVEAMAFAWLARETLENRPGNLPEVTGAKGPRVLGAIYPA